MKLVKGSLKVEGDAKTKALVYGGAAAMVLAILLVMYLLVGRIGGGPPEVGTVTLKSMDISVPPLENEIYVTKDGEKKEKRRLVPGEIGNRAPTLPYDHSLTVAFEGKSDNGPFTFTIYDENEKVYTEKTDQFLCPEKPGKYLVCEETYWGDKNDNIGMEYYFWIEIES